jgi:hypothetical protein
MNIFFENLNVGKAKLFLGIQNTVSPDFEVFLAIW